MAVLPFGNSAFSLRAGWILRHSPTLVVVVWITSVSELGVSDVSELGVSDVSELPRCLNYLGVWIGCVWCVWIGCVWCVWITSVSELPRCLNYLGVWITSVSELPRCLNYLGVWIGCVWCVWIGCVWCVWITSVWITSMSGLPMSWPVFRVFKACLGLCFVCLRLVLAFVSCV
jgi:hypothetical protein